MELYLDNFSHLSDNDLFSIDGGYHVMMIIGGFIQFSLGPIVISIIGIILLKKSGLFL